MVRLAILPVDAINGVTRPRTTAVLRTEPNIMVAIEKVRVVMCVLSCVFSVAEVG